MIQSSYNQPITPKASSEAKAKPKDLLSAVGENDFKKELKSADKTSNKTSQTESDKKAKDVEATTSSSSDVKSVNVSSDMELEKPSDIINAQNVQGDPKVFDASLTESVEEILQPKSVDAAPVKLTDDQILKLANGEISTVEGEIDSEISQAMLKTPQIQSGRSPAIEFAQSEIDPQLLSNEDFVTQKNLMAKKNLNSSAYGMNRPQVQKMALENGLKETQIINESAGADASAQGPLSSQQFILSMQAEMNGSSKVNGIENTQKVFDMSNIKASNSSEIIDQISNYISQAKAAKEPTVSMRVNHEELGIIDITVQKTLAVGQNAVAISIGAHSSDGKNFFQQNSKDLFAHLASAGVNVSDLKFENSSTAKNSFDMNQQSGRQGSEASQEKQFGSEQNQRRHESDRRQDLWRVLTDKEAA